MGLIPLKESPMFRLEERCSSHFQGVDFHFPKILPLSKDFSSSPYIPSFYRPKIPPLIKDVH
jgi:hypothetical protein